jgi:hypothetical protein
METDTVAVLIGQPKHFGYFSSKQERVLHILLHMDVCNLLLYISHKL